MTIGFLPQLSRPSILARTVKRLAGARYRLCRRKFGALRKRTTFRVLLAFLKVRNQLYFKGSATFTFACRWIATAAGLLFAALFVLTLPEAQITTADFKTSEVHLASAGIIGTALALVLSLSIVPAQKAADVFSSAILKLYGRDRTTLGVFSLLSCAALASLLLGTGWTLGFSPSPRYTLAGQLVLLGASLDTLRVFYNRALDLLDPMTALSLVRNECSRHIQRAKSGVERLVRIQRVALGDGINVEAFRYACYSNSNLANVLTAWTTQLEEFARKAIARRDTQAVNAIVRTMAEIGKTYAEARRDSMLLLPDLSDGMPIGVSDIGVVLDPIYENIKAICEDAAKHPNEAVVQGCIATLGDLAAHAMTMVHTSSYQRRTAPLAFSPVFYIGLCVKPALAAGMEDALLTAVTATGRIFSQISKGVDTQAAEEQALDVLFSIAAASYPRHDQVSCFKSVEMMMLAALHDIRVRGYRDTGSLLSVVLPKIAILMPSEAAMDKMGQRIMKAFPPYAPDFEANIPALLNEIAKQVQPGLSVTNPFGDFEEASTAIRRHYRDVAEKVSFNGVLLEKWVVDSLLNAADVHLNLLNNPSPGTDIFLDIVDVRLRWLLHASAFFFQEKAEFPYHHAKDACDHLAVLGMKLLQRARLESVVACGEVIRSIAHRSAKAENPTSYTSPYGFADCIVKLELVARAADEFGYPAVATQFRALSSKPDDIPDEKWPNFVEAIANRTRQMEDTLHQRDRGYRIRPEPEAELREILRQKRSTAAV